MRKLHLSSISLLALSIAAPACAQQSLPTIEIGATPLRAESRAPTRAVAAPSRTTDATRATINPSAPTGAGNQTPYVSPLVTYQIPAAVHVVEGAEIANVRKFNLGEALQRTAPGVIINDVGGNPALVFTGAVDLVSYVQSDVLPGFNRYVRVNGGSWMFWAGPYSEGAPGSGDISIPLDPADEPPADPTTITMLEIKFQRENVIDIDPSNDQILIKGRGCDINIQSDSITNIQTNSYEWSFDSNGIFNTPSGLRTRQIQAPVDGTQMFQDANGWLSIASQGTSGVTQVGWAQDPLGGSSIALASFNDGESEIGRAHV